MGVAQKQLVQGSRINNYQIIWQDHVLRKHIQSGGEIRMD